MNSALDRATKPQEIVHLREAGCGRIPASIQPLLCYRFGNKTLHLRPILFRVFLGIWVGLCAADEMPNQSQHDSKVTRGVRAAESGAGERTSMP